MLPETHIKEHRMTWKEPVVAYFKVLALTSLAVLQKTTMTAEHSVFRPGYERGTFRIQVRNVTTFDSLLSGATDALNKRCRKSEKNTRTSCPIHI
jgi:hypothetical protein